MGSSRARGKSSGPKNQLWTAVLFNGAPVSDSPAIEGGIVEPADWSSAAGFEKATLLRIRGWLSIVPVASSASAGTCFIAIYKVDADDPVRAFDNVVEYVDEDVIWTGGVSWTAATATPDLVPKTLVVDVKSMRKIDVAQEIRVSFVCGAVNDDCLVSGVLRALVRKGGN